MANTDDRQDATLTTSVYIQLRSDLLSGRLRPGEKLAAEALRSRFKIGSTPIREALNRLLAEGFVALEAQKGFSVAPVSEKDLRELVTARCWIDGMAVRQSIANQDMAWEEELLLAFHRLSRSHRQSAENTDVSDPNWEQLHRRFHTALVGGCGSHWVCKISEQLFDAAERYRLLAADQVPERNELEEHRAILDASIERRPDDAIRLLELHYGRTFDVIVDAMGKAS
jgi:GntR family carbon starvation induced transcriptional regulator